MDALAILHLYLFATLHATKSVFPQHSLYSLLSESGLTITCKLKKKHMGLAVRKSVFGVSDKTGFKAVSSDTETS